MRALSRRFGPILLALLVVLGQIKGNPLLAWVPFDLTIIVSGLVLACAFVSRVHEGRTTGRVGAPLLLWVLFLPAIALVTTWDSYSSTKVLTLFTVTLTLAIAPFYLMRFDDQRRRFLITSVVVAMLALADAMFFSEEPVMEGRLEFDGSNTIGSARVAMAGAIILIIAASTPGTRHRWRLPFAALGIGAAVSAIMTGSRGPVVAAAIALIVTAFIAPGLRRYRGRMIVALTLVAALVVWFSESTTGFDRLLLLLDENGTSQQSRVFLLQMSWDMFQAHPFGTGWGTFTAQNGFYRYPHNLLAEIGVEAGLIVLAIVALGLLATAIRAARAAQDGTTITLFALLIFAIFNAMVSGDINASRLMVVVIFAVWVLPSVTPMNGEPKPAPTPTRRVLRASAPTR